MSEGGDGSPKVVVRTTDEENGEDPKLTAEKSAPYVLPNETKELERVFRYLVNFDKKQPMLQEIQRLKAQQKEIEGLFRNKGRGTLTRKSKADQTIATASKYANLSEERLNQEHKQLARRIDDLQKNIAKLSQLTHTISADAFAVALKEQLNHDIPRAKLEKLIWEIDEDLDGCVDWDEFTLMFERSIADTTGLEPFDFFNVIQFMMYDADQDGLITMDECITMLYQRYGHAKLENELQNIFAGHGKQMQLTGGWAGGWVVWFFAKGVIRMVECNEVRGELCCRWWFWCR
jgi:Ca2+-binding EF-hand superfamily protein